MKCDHPDCEGHTEPLGLVTDYEALGPPPAMKAITGFVHCGRCLDNLPAGESPESYARLSVGLTPWGLQVWCVRHSCNVMHLSFHGEPHDSNEQDVDSDEATRESVARLHKMQLRAREPSTRRRVRFRRPS